MQAQDKDLSLEQKSEILHVTVRDMGSVIIAYSGGVDSSLLAAVGNASLGARALAVTAKSPSLAPSELQAALSVAQGLSLNHRVIETNEMQRDDYRANSPQRCYFCKDELYKCLMVIAREEGYAHIANGTNTDDLGDYRPGLDAALQYQVRSPLVEAGLTKRDVRSLAKSLGLKTWDKPAQPCLSSRIPYGTPVSTTALRMIAESEEFIRSLGVKHVRVRHHDTTARIEISPDGFLSMMDKKVREKVTLRLRKIGYSYVSLDLDGYRSGSLNETIDGISHKSKDHSKQTAE